MLPEEQIRHKRVGHPCLMSVDIRKAVGKEGGKANRDDVATVILQSGQKKLQHE